MATNDAGQLARSRVGVFDAGVGGLPVAARLRRHRPDVELVYLADSARRPYGPRPGAEVAGFLAQVTAFFDEAGCDVWVVACNTASVVADLVAGGRAARVDMVQAAVAAAGHSDPSVPLGLLATAGTVQSNAIPHALGTRPTRSIATEELLRLAEAGSTDHARLQHLAADALDQLRLAGCAQVLLACTDYTCVLGDLEAVCGGLTLLDPLDAVVDLTLALLAPPAPQQADPPRDRLCLTGPHPLDVQAFALKRFGLALPPPELISLPNPTPAPVANERSAR